MVFHEKIKGEVQEAMRARDSMRLEVLRGMLTAFVNELVAKKRKPQELLADEEALAVVARLARQRKDSIEQFENGGRDDLVQKENAELAILETYLPPQLSCDEVEKVVREKKEALGVSDKSGIGKLIGAVMVELKGKVDGGVVREVAESLFT